VAGGGVTRTMAHGILGIRHRQRMVVRLDPALRGAFGRATCLTNEPSRQGPGPREEAGAPAVRSAASAPALGCDSVSQACSVATMPGPARPSIVTPAGFLGS
jgi:hypothetical protein